MTTELLPCPFCGGMPTVYATGENVTCETDGCPLKKVVKFSRKAWNTRAHVPAPVPDEARKAALEALDGDYATLEQPDGTFRLDSWKFMRAMVEHSETIRSALSSPAWQDIGTFDSRMFSLMTDGTPDGTEVVKYKGEVPGWATKWMPLP